MKRFVLAYKDDPPVEGHVMTGAEFKQVVRGGGPGQIGISGFNGPDIVIEFDEIVCDACNAEVLDDEQLALVADRVWCMHGCYQERIAPYLK